MPTVQFQDNHALTVFLMPIMKLYYCVLKAACAIALVLNLPLATANAPDTALPTQMSSKELAAQTAYEKGHLRTAQRHFTALANAGNAWAMYNLAAMHMQRQARPSQQKQAQFWLEKAANTGYGQALYVLGKAYEGAHFGTKNLVMAARYYELAAQAGILAGQIEYATALYLGRGVPQNIEQAGEWYLAAARAGDTDAQTMVARMFETGEGQPLDARLAQHWYTQAAKNGDLPSQAKLFAYEREAAAQTSTQ